MPSEKFWNRGAYEGESHDLEVSWGPSFGRINGSLVVHPDDASAVDRLIASLKRMRRSYDRTK